MVPATKKAALGGCGWRANVAAVKEIAGDYRRREHALKSIGTDGTDQKRKGHASDVQAWPELKRERGCFL